MPLFSIVRFLPVVLFPRKQTPNELRELVISPCRKITNFCHNGNVNKFCYRDYEWPDVVKPHSEWIFGEIHKYQRNRKSNRNLANVARISGILLINLWINCRYSIDIMSGMYWKPKLHKLQKMRTVMKNCKIYMS